MPVSTLLYEAGKYIGETKNGVLHGRGKFIYHNGDVYEGEFRKGVQQGKGKFKWANGDCYEGDWVNDKMHGKGIMRFGNGDVYEGQYVHDRMEGYGVLKTSEYIYEGQMKDDLKHGRGKQTMKNHDFYDGEWDHDKRHGKGFYRWANGDSYDGDYKNDLKDGRGLFRWDNGDTYDGEVRNGLKHGKGVLRYADGRYYIGNFIDGHPDGKQPIHHPRVLAPTAPIPSPSPSPSPSPAPPFGMAAPPPASPSLSSIPILPPTPAISTTAPSPQYLGGSASTSISMSSPSVAAGLAQHLGGPASPPALNMPAPPPAQKPNQTFNPSAFNPSTPASAPPATHLRPSGGYSAYSSIRRVSVDRESQSSQPLPPTTAAPTAQVVVTEPTSAPAKPHTKSSSKGPQTPQAGGRPRSATASSSGSAAAAAAAKTKSPGVTRGTTPRPSAGPGAAPVKQPYTPAPLKRPAARVSDGGAKSAAKVLPRKTSANNMRSGSSSEAGPNGGGLVAPPSAIAPSSVATSSSSSSSPTSSGGVLNTTQNSSHNGGAYSPPRATVIASSPSSSAPTQHHSPVSSATAMGSFNSAASAPVEAVKSVSIARTSPRPSRNDDDEVIDLKDWKRGNMIGKGAFGQVYLGMLANGKFIAVKTVEFGAEKATEEVDAFQQELDLMKGLKHRNIVRYYGCELDNENNVFNIFIEYVPQGTLSAIAKKFSPLPYPTVKSYTIQILEGLHYLHNNGIVHRDIKGENILLDNEGVVKLADFGCSKKLDQLCSKTHGCNTMVGTPYWMAPEVISNETGYGAKADIWSVGCTIVEMLTAKPPWPEFASMWSAIYHIANSKGPPPGIPKNLPKALHDFLNFCFEREVQKRPNAEELMKLPFICSGEAIFNTSPSKGRGSQSPMRRPPSSHSLKRKGTQSKLERSGSSPTIDDNIMQQIRRQSNADEYGHPKPQTLPRGASFATGALKPAQGSTPTSGGGGGSSYASPSSNENSSPASRSISRVGSFGRTGSMRRMGSERMSSSISRPRPS